MGYDQGSCVTDGGRLERTGRDRWIERKAKRAPTSPTAVFPLPSAVAASIKGLAQSAVYICIYINIPPPDLSTVLGCFGVSARVFSNYRRHTSSRDGDVRKSGNEVPASPAGVCRHPVCIDEQK